MGESPVNDQFSEETEKQSVFFQMNGGRRPGAGRKKGGRNAAQLKIIDIAGQVLE